MTRKTFEIHPDIRSGRVGLAIGEMGVIHLGYVSLLALMAATCDTAIIGFGSSQLEGVPGHPMSFTRKCEQVNGIFGPLFKYIALQDIDASIDSDDWTLYWQSRLENNNLPAPTDYFCGSKEDAIFYTKHFAPFEDEVTHNGQVTTYSSRATGRRLHIIDRSVTPQLQGRQIRLLIEKRDPEWHRFVPEKLWQYIENNYPPRLRSAIHVDEAPADIPIGTRVIFRNNPNTVLELKDDGVLRPLLERKDEKAMWSAAHQL